MRKIEVVLMLCIAANLVLLSQRSFRSALDGQFSLKFKPCGASPAVADPEYWRQWHLHSGEGNVTPNISAAWSRTTGSSRIEIGVLDSGVDTDQPDLQGRLNLLLGRDFGDSDDNPEDDLLHANGGGHGTWVTGVIAAMHNNGIYVSGVDWNAQIIPVKWMNALNLGPFGHLDWSLEHNAAEAVGYANDMGCEIINMSFGSTENIQFPDDLAASITDECYRAYQDGRLLVAAAGNENSNQPHYPAALRSVLGVGASNENGTKASFSNYGLQVDIVAPGVNIFTLDRTNGWAGFQGTSAAAPIVSGIAGLLWAQNPDFLTNDDIWQLMRLTAQDIDPPGWDPATGCGVVDADSASKALADGTMRVTDHSTGFSRSLFQGIHQHYFRNNGGLATEKYWVETYRYTKHVTFSGNGFIAKPLVWVRARQTKGWSNANPNFEWGFGNIVDGSLDSLGCDIETFAYLQKYNLLGQTVNHWWPCDNPPCESGPDIRVEMVTLGLPAMLPAADVTAQAVNSPPGILLTWTDTNNNETQYEIWRETVSTLAGAVIILPGTNVTSGIDSDISGSELYDYCIGVYNPTEGRGPFSDTIRIHNKPNKPENVAAHTHSSGKLRVDVSWSPPIRQKAGTLDHYRVCVSHSPGYEYVVSDGITTTSTSFYIGSGLPIFVTVYAVDTDLTIGRPSHTVIANPYEPPPPGGCPYLFAWDGARFAEENTILGHVDNNALAKASPDFYRLHTSMTPDDGRYRLQIREFENEQSTFDDFKLTAIDHPAATLVNVTKEGRMSIHRGELLPASAIDDQGVDCLAEVIEEDGVFFSRQTAGTLTLTYFIGKNIGTETMALETGPPPPPGEKKINGGGNSGPGLMITEVLAGDGSWVRLDDLADRANDGTEHIMVNPTDYIVDGQLVIRKSWESNAYVDKFSMLLPSREIPQITELQLMAATHSQQGDILNQVMLPDGDIATLIPGESIELSFADPTDQPVKNGYVRDFVFGANGYYTSYKGNAAIPGTYRLSQNYPNPFNPSTTIYYNLVSTTNVDLAVYNMLGQKVKTLVNTMQQAGEQSAVWDGTDDTGIPVASGIYMYKLTTPDYAASRKMILMK